MMDEKTLRYALQCADVYALKVAKILKTPSCQEDFRQQILLRFIRNFPKYDSTKGTIKTFLTINADLESRLILRKYRSLKNRIFYNAYRIT